jgi:hypothetical protein
LFDRILPASLPWPAEFKPAPDVANPQASFDFSVHGRPRHGSHGEFAISAGGKSVARTFSRRVTAISRSVAHAISQSFVHAISRSFAYAVSQSFVHAISRSFADCDSVAEAGSKIVSHTR